jgi:TRAP-type uncharacterized transport system fused permease subunit
MALLIIWAISVFFGMVGVGAASYIIVSIFGVPALMKMGVNLATAHFFILYACAFSFVTPPVAPGALIACKLAGSPYMKTAWEATKVAIVGIFIPFVFVYAPVMLLFPQEPVSAVLCIMAAVAFIVALQSSFVGYFMRSCTLWERTLGLTATVILGVYVVTQALGWFLLGMVLFVVMVAWQWRKKRATGLLQTTVYGGQE